MDKLIMLDNETFVAASEVSSVQRVDAYCGVYRLTLKDGRQFETHKPNIVDEINEALRD